MGSLRRCEFCGEKLERMCQCSEHYVRCSECGQEMPINHAVQSAVFDDQWICKRCAKGQHEWDMRGMR